MMQEKGAFSIWRQGTLCRQRPANFYGGADGSAEAQK